MEMSEQGGWEGEKWLNIFFEIPFVETFLWFELLHRFLSQCFDIFCICHKDQECE